MKLSDIMGAASLSSYAQVALVLFCAAFTVVILRVILRREKQATAHRRLKQLPLTDGHVVHRRIDAVSAKRVPHGRS